MIKEILGYQGPKDARDGSGGQREGKGRVGGNFTILYTIHYTLYIIHYTLYTIHYTL